MWVQGCKGPARGPQEQVEGTGEMKPQPDTVAQRQSTSTPTSMEARGDCQETLMSSQKAEASPACCKGHSREHAAQTLGNSLSLPVAMLGPGREPEMPVPASTGILVMLLLVCPLLGLPPPFCCPPRYHSPDPCNTAAVAPSSPAPARAPGRESCPHVPFTQAGSSQ